MEEKRYIAIDLKSFYASVECIDRGLDPMDANLVVADLSRTQKTICLAVSPALKCFGVPGRPRLFEVEQRVAELNRARRSRMHFRPFARASHFLSELSEDGTLAVDYIVAPPRMAHYIEYSTRIYKIYLEYAAPEDIHVYSIDEVFIDATQYLKTAGCTAREYAMRIVRHVLRETGITATAGIGSNLFLCKVAMDIVAKHSPADADGVRIAELDEASYRRTLWAHTPITDFWRVGRGYAEKLAGYGLYTMGDVARCSAGKGPVYNEDLLYDLFGVNAELLIDHAWGWEPCTMADIKAYRPQTNSLSSGQVLQEPYTFDKARTVLSEMAESLALDLVAKGLVTDKIVLTVGYDAQNEGYRGERTVDMYGRSIPKHAHGTSNLPMQTSSGMLVRDAACALFDRIVNKKLAIRRLNISAERVVPEGEIRPSAPEQLDMFTDYAEEESKNSALLAEAEREKKRQKAVLEIVQKYGKNALLKGTSLKEGATARERNRQIGGHKA